MPTLSVLMPRTHLPSHWFSCGHTRPHTAGSALDALSTAYAPSMSSSATFAIKAGISIFTGQPLTQGLFLQFRQRFASFTAIS